MCFSNDRFLFIMLPNSTYSKISPYSIYNIRKNVDPFVSCKSFNKYSQNLGNRDKGSLGILGESSRKRFSAVNNNKIKSNQLVLSKKSKYKWENKNNRVAVSPVTLGNSTHWFKKTDYRLTPSSSRVNRITENTSNNHYRSSIPFNSVITKGWFYRNVCGIDCVDGVPLDLQSCCFISERFVPGNTLSVDELLKEINENSRKNSDTNDAEKRNSFVALSKHKLIRKEIRTTSTLPAPKIVSPLVLDTRRPLIRKTRSNFTESSKPISSVTLPIPKKTYEKQDDIAPSGVSSSRKKSTYSSSIVQHHSSFVVLTKRKLVRKHASSLNADFTPNRKKSSKSTIVQSPEKLISVNRNKLIRSSLLRKSVKPSKSTSSFPANSVLYHMIQYRRRPYPGSSYVLLTRNKLIKRVRFGHGVWRKHAEPSSKETRSAKRTIVSSPKTFVRVGSNKLIRKSLFTKCNKNDAQKTAGQFASPFQKMMLARVLSSPCKRIQRFTNHLSRVNLKYVSERAASNVRNKFKNRCKNNRRTLRSKKNATVCPVFRRRGECLKRTKNCCSMLHDAKYISLCKNKLRGVCENASCSLSHDLIPQKVPVCLHYLKDSCAVDECPYLHVRPDPNAPICVPFLRGYCGSAEQCPNWHLYACQEFKSSSTCGKGDNCRLPHRSVDYFEWKTFDTNKEAENVASWRYFEKNKLTDDDRGSIPVIPQREQMGALPDFIPL